MSLKPRTLTLNDGMVMPQLGLGLMFVPEGTLTALLQAAVDIGYRHFDTATHYGNEQEVGDALCTLDIERDAVTVTTKLPDGMHGYDKTLRAFDVSEKALGKIDQYLIHWPQPMKGLYRETWKAMVSLQRENRVRSIGVANFLPPLIMEIFDDTGVMPAINQIEMHPGCQQADLRAFYDRHAIVTQAWSPLEHGKVFSREPIVEIAQRLKRTPAQVVLRWHLQSGVLPIPKASSRKNLEDNFGAWDFELSAAEMAVINALDAGASSFGADPMQQQSDRGKIA